GALFLAVVLACLAVPGTDWPQLSLVYLAGVLLIPLAGLPLIVRPAVAWAGLALCSAVLGMMLWLVQATPGEKMAFAFYFAVSACVGMVLRRARANLAVRLDREVESLWQRATRDLLTGLDRKSTRLNSSHVKISYAVFHWRALSSFPTRRSSDLAVLGMMLWLVQATPGEKMAFAFYFAVSACVGMVLRRARANLAVRLDREVESLWQRATRDLLTG